MPATPPKSPRDLLDRLSQLGIAYTNHTHAPLMTVAQSQELRGTIAGLHAKNLFLKDKKGGLWLVVCEEERAVDLKQLRKRLGVQNLSFGKPDLLMDALGVAPGSVTPFAVLNDAPGRVRVVLDRALADGERVNFHPLDNAQTTSLRGPDLLAFLAAQDHEPLILDFESETPPGAQAAR